MQMAKRCLFNPTGGLGFLVAVFVCFSVWGCASTQGGSGIPAPRPLAAQFDAYQPPESPPDEADASTASELPGVLTESDAVLLALKSNPELRSAGLAFRAGEYRTQQAGRYANPEFEVEVEEFGGAGERGGFDGSATTYMLSQEIDLSGKFAKDSKVAKLERDLAGWDFEAARLDVVTNVRTAFLQMLAAQERLKLAEQQIEVSEQVRQTVETLVQRAALPELELARARVESANSGIEKNRAASDLRVAGRMLSAAIGAGDEPAVQVSGNLETVDPVPDPKLLGQWIEQNPELARGPLEFQLDEAAVAVEKAARFPDLTISGGVQRVAEADDTTFVVGIGIPLPIFDRNQGGMNAARFEAARNREAKRATDQRIRSEVAAAYQSLETAYNEIQALGKEILPDAQKAFDGAEQMVLRGKSSMLEALDAKRTLFEVRMQYIESLESYHLSRIELERLIGRSLDDLGNPPGSNAKQGD
jgi:outer membrane protein, heavy metal efflux system